MSTSAQDDDPVTDARCLATGIAMDLHFALQASTVTVAVMSAFIRLGPMFRMHPANTLPYQALAALEERSTVHIYEWLNKSGRTLKVAPEIRADWQELRNHRDYASHAGESEWRRPEMRAFAEAGRYVHLRTVEIWRATRQIREQLRDEHRGLLPTEVPLNYSMVMMFDAILRGSMTAEAIEKLPPVPALFEQVQAFAAEYMRELDEHVQRPTP